MQPGDRVKPGMAIAILDDADQKLALSRAEAQLAQQRNNLARLEVGTRQEIIAQRRAAVSSAQAREREAVDNLRRNSELVKQGAIAQRLLVEARAAVDEARGETLEAQAELAEAKAGPTREVIEAQKANVAAAMSVVNQAKLQIKKNNPCSPLIVITKAKIKLLRNQIPMLRGSIDVEKGIQTVLVFLRLFCSNGLQAFIPSQEESFNQILALSDEIDY